MKIGILEPANFSQQALAELNNIGIVELFDGKNINSFILDKTILFVRLAYDLDAIFLKKAKSLKIICSPTTGLNHVDSDFCKKNGISIICLRGETLFLNTIRATPEHTLGLIIALKRNYHTAFLGKENMVWDREPHKGFEIFDSQIGIIGLGRVGSIVSTYLKALGARVGFYDINQEIKDDNLKSFKTIESLIKWADTIVLTANYTFDQGVIISKELIDLLEGKYFINTARAELTVEEYLAQKAQKGFFKGLAIDVITNEQSNQTHLGAFLNAGKEHNVIVTPHIGGATFTSMARTEEFIVSKLVKVFLN